VNGLATLAQAEAWLAMHRPADFDSPTSFAAPESIEAVRVVEDNGFWKSKYESVEAFYKAHEAQHPDIRVYGDVRREIATADPLTSPGGMISERIARHRNAAN
jgi:hypothetical protein